MDDELDRVLGRLEEALREARDDYRNGQSRNGPLPHNSRELINWCSGIYTKTTRSDGTTVEDKELLWCNVCGQVFVQSYGNAHMQSHREASE